MLTLYKTAGVSKGFPDLVLWDPEKESCRLVEVKNPQWDKLSTEQDRFLAAARKLRISAKVVNWAFRD